MWIGVTMLCWAAAAQVPKAPDPLEGVRIEQRLNAQVPLDLVFRDEAAREVKLGDYFAEDKPVLLALVYYECPMLCNLTLNGTLRALRAMTFDAGKQFQVLTVSFDPREKPSLALAKKSKYLREYGRDGAERGWHFLTGDEASITKLTEAVGFYYRYDEELGQYAHATALILLTPDGRVAQYYYGVEYAPRDLRLGIIEATRGQIGSLADEILLYCYAYDPTTGTYGLAIMNILRVAGTVTVLALASFMVVMLRRDRRTPPPAAA